MKASVQGDDGPGHGRKAGSAKLQPAAPATPLLAPIEDVPRINLRSQAEPWEMRYQLGEAMRRRVPHDVHATWVPPEDRPDPVATVLASNAGRQSHLVPLRMYRMAESAFAFVRGAASVMAWDLSRTPVSGISVFLDGDAHLDNFGLFGTPTLEVVLDLNDFDEATAGPWEFDVKRLVASVNVAARAQGLGRRDRRAAVLGAMSAYRTEMHQLASFGAVDTWYLAANAETLQMSGLEIGPKAQAALRRMAGKARKRNNAALLEKIGERRVDGGWRLRLDPPILTRVSETARQKVLVALERYAETLPRERRFMLQRYNVVDVAHRVVGVGSVGTRAYLALLFGNSDRDALFLQVKEAVPPALKPYVPPLPEPYASDDGHRVVYGQHLLQAIGDPLLGWTAIDGRSYYVRQMRNLKGSLPVEWLANRSFGFYPGVLAALLARAHARTGDAAAIAGYCGEEGGLDVAFAAWAEAYGDQNEADHAALMAAIGDGRVTASSEAEMVED